MPHRQSRPRTVTRRDFIKLSSVSAGALLTGCVTNPVTGRSQLMLVSGNEEIAMDRKSSPHQLSADYGVVQDRKLNAYVHGLGLRLATLGHRPNMPYAFRAVNANYINAYAFPGGTIAATRGILIGLDNEAELAALLGHELGHVCARHTAQQMTKGIVSSTVLAGVTKYASTKDERLGSIAAGLGQVGVGVLLARYSRENEREADNLGLEYMVKAGQNPKGFVGLMDMLRSTSQHKPNVVELMFATHPMSSERYATAVKQVTTTYAGARGLPLGRERYMDNTAALRALREPIENMQKGEGAMGAGDFTQAEAHLKRAVAKAPGDYPANVLMAKCCLAQKQYAQAATYADRAVAIYPEEAQGHHIGGMAKIGAGKYGEAYNGFAAYEKLLPGNPNTVFFKGRALEGMQRREESAREYIRYLNQVREGDLAQYAHERLVQWGVVTGD